MELPIGGTYCYTPGKLLGKEQFELLFIDNILGYSYWLFHPVFDHRDSKNKKKLDLSGQRLTLATYTSDP